MDDRPVIEARDLVKVFNDHKRVLDGVSFSLMAHDFVVITGRSGSGKTTLLNILGGLDRPTSGDVLIDGDGITGLAEDDLARLRLEKIGFVFQDYNLLPDLTVEENVALPLRFSKGKERKADVAGLLDKFGIEEIRGEKANKISGGEAQRAAIARAMMNRPSIILADEPTGNLDSENAGNVLEAFELARKEFGATVVLATHDPSLAETGRRRIVIEGGKAAFAGNQ